MSVNRTLSDYLKKANRALEGALAIAMEDPLDDELWMKLASLTVQLGNLSHKLEQEADDVEGADVLPDDPNLWHGSARSEQGLCTPSEVAQVNALLNAGPDEPIEEPS